METNWLVLEGVQTADDDGLNYGVTNGDDKWMDVGYIFRVNHLGLLDCILGVRKREESGICVFFVRTIGWIVVPFSYVIDGAASQNFYFCHISL